MPYYEYRCASNGQTLEVRHGMDERFSTWGELARRAGADPGDTAPDAPVERLMSAPVPLTGSGGGEADFRGCGSGCACVPQS
jgi:predicted nucleic acid-binding Zn ribbon protein